MEFTYDDLMNIRNALSSRIADLSFTIERAYTNKDYYRAHKLEERKKAYIDTHFKVIQLIEKSCELHEMPIE